MKNSKTTVLILSFILFVGLLITYSNHFNNGFHFDDSHAIVDNVHIRQLKNIPQFFYNPKTGSARSDRWGLRPTITTSLAIDYWLGGGLTPFYFQLSTFIWFVVICIFLFFIYNNLISRSLNHPWTPYFALAAASLYAFHPANAETINYIISRSDVISTLCVIICSFIYISYVHLRKYYIYLIPAIIGTFSKETMIVVVPLLFFYVTLFENQLSFGDLFKAKNFQKIFKIAINLLPLFLIIVSCQLYMLLKAPPAPGNLSNPFLPYVLTQSYVWVHYFTTFFFPFNLSADTDMGIIDPIDYRIVIGLLFIAALVYTIFKTSQKVQTRPITFGLLWFSLTLLPTSLAPLAEVTNDHRMFFPFIGLSLAVVYLFALLIKKYESKLLMYPKFGIFLGAITFIILFLCAYGTIQRNKVWKSEETLWYDVTLKSPKNGRGLMNYGLTQMSKGNYSEALSFFEKALKYTPDYYSLYINLGVVKNALGKPAEAEEDFKKAISLMPSLYESYFYYARFLKQNQRIDEAKEMDKKSLVISPYFMDSRYLLMQIYQEKELWDSLKDMAEKTLELDPQNKSAKEYLEAGNARKSKLDNAIIQASNNKTPEDYLNLSLQFYNKAQYLKCIDACEEAIKLKPDYAAAYSNMCAAYNNLKQWDKAIEACNHALKIDPQHKLANGNLNWAKNQKKLAK